MTHHGDTEDKEGGRRCSSLCSLRALCVSVVSPRSAAVKPKIDPSRATFLLTCAPFSRLICRALSNSHGSHTHNHALSNSHGSHTHNHALPHTVRRRLRH